MRKIERKQTVFLADSIYNNRQDCQGILGGIEMQTTTRKDYNFKLAKERMRKEMN